MKIIIAGAGEVGVHLAKMLSHENHDIIVIDNEEDTLRMVRAGIDLLTVNGSATSIDALHEANVESTDLFIAVTQAESTNITAAILAKKYGAKKVIARIENQEFLEEEKIGVVRSLGIDYLIHPEAIAAREIVGLLHQTGSTDIVETAGGRLCVYVVKMEEDAPVIEKTLHNVAERMSSIDFRAVVIKRDEEIIIPKGDDIFKKGDVVYAIAKREGVDELMYFSGKEKFLPKNVMILGGSRIGVLTAQGLGAHHNTKLIESNREKCYTLSNRLKNALVINGDGRNIDLLNEEKIEKMDAFVAVTGSPETNILACIHAISLGVKKTIAEVENFNYMDLAEKLGIDTIINKKLGAANRIYRFTAAQGPIIGMKHLRGTEAELLEIDVQVDSKVSGKLVRDMKFPKGVILGGVVRGEYAEIITGNTILKPKDRIIAVAMPSAIKDVRKLFA
jgi:trk system potassium uptake protein